MDPGDEKDAELMALAEEGEPIPDEDEDAAGEEEEDDDEDGKDDEDLETLAVSWTSF